VIKWPVKLYICFNVFLRFFQNPKNMTFYVFLSCCSRFLEHCLTVSLKLVNRALLVVHIVYILCFVAELSILSVIHCTHLRSIV